MVGVLIFFYCSKNRLLCCRWRVVMALSVSRVMEFRVGSSMGKNGKIPVSSYYVVEFCRLWLVLEKYSLEIRTFFVKKSQIIE